MNPNESQEKAAKTVRRLLWVYFGLLLLEGALRKWIVPQLSNPLLVIRDPVALLIYFYALTAHVFPRNGWTLALVILGALSTVATVVQLFPYLPLKPIALITIYGVHANFFHLPLIFVMAEVLRPEDVKKFGWWILAIVIPMAVLMVAQFRAAPDAFLNRTAGGEGEMMLSALGKVRTAGPFSFVIGVVAYVGLASAYLLWGALRPGIYRTWLLSAAGAAMLVGIAVSGSRTVVSGCILVLACLVVVFFLRREAVNRVGLALMIALPVAFIASRFAVFQEGVNVLSTRFNEVAEASEQSMALGLLGRVYGPFVEAWQVLSKAPFLGYGLGIGTNVGANILTGHSVFLLTEDEPARIILECGPILGVAYVLLRLALAVWIGWMCLKAVRRGNLLPLFLFSSTCVSLVDGQFGQPTILGFAVFATGLTLAALNAEREVILTPGLPAGPPIKRVVRRSVFAERLHGTPAVHAPSHGPVDR